MVGERRPNPRVKCSAACFIGGPYPNRYQVGVAPLITRCHLTSKCRIGRGILDPAVLAAAPGARHMLALFSKKSRRKHVAAYLLHCKMQTSNVRRQPDTVGPSQLLVVSNGNFDASFYAPAEKPGVVLVHLSITGTGMVVLCTNRG